MPFASVNYGITLTSGVVQSGLIGNSAVLSGNIGSGQIGLIHLASGTLQAATLSSGIVTSGYIGVGAINSVNIASGSITTSMLASGFSVPVAVSSGSVSSGSITAGAVTSGTIAAGAITSGTISAGAVTSGTIAAGSITSGTISVGAVTSGTIAAGAVTSGSLAFGSVTSGTIAAGAVTSGALSSGSVTAGSISQNAIVSGNLSSGSVTYTSISSGFIKAGTNVSVVLDPTGTYTISATGGGGASVSGQLIVGSGLFLNSGTLYNGNSDQIISIASGAIISTMLGSGAVTTSSIASGAITSTQIGSGAVTASSIASGSITVQSFGSGVLTQILVVSGGVQSGSIAPNAITSGTIASGAVTGTTIASGTITSTNISSGTITSTNIADGTITGTNISSGTITSTNIASGTITGSNLSSGTITSTNVASGAITGVNMASGFIKAGTNIAITQDAVGNYTINSTGAGGASISGKLSIGTGLVGNSGTIFDGLSDLTVSVGSGAITSTMLGSGSVTSLSIASGSVTSTSIASGSITINSLASGLTTQILSVSGGIQSGAIASGSITGTTIASGSITSINIASGTITSTNISSGAITSTNVASGTLLGSNLASGTVTGTNIASGFINAGNNIYITQAADGSYTINSSGSGGGLASGASLVAGSGLVMNSGTAFDGSMAQTISIASGAITSTMIGSGAVTSTSIASGSITINSLSSGLTTQILSVSGGIQSGAISSGSITGTTIASGTITSVNISSGTITSENIASGTLTGTNMASGTITTNNIASGAVGPYQIASGSFQVKAAPGAPVVVTYLDVNTFEISASGGGTTSAIYPLTATSGLILDVGSDFDGTSGRKIGIASGGVTAEHIANDAVTSGKIAAGSITYNQMASGFLFQTNLTVNLTSGKTFGKFLNGQTVPSSGKSALDVIILACTEATNPLATISGSPRTYNFDTLSFVNTLTYSGSATTPGATLSNSLIEFRRGGTGSWTTVFSGATGNGTALHSGTNSSGDYTTFDYRYTVTDSSNSTATATTSIDILDPVAPSMSLNVSPLNYVFGTTAISTTLNYSATINTVGASGKIAVLEYRRANSGAYTLLYSGLAYSGSFVHNDTNASSNTDSYDYKFTFVDTAGMSGATTASVAIISYTPPTVGTLYASGTSLTGPETNSIREQGNAFSNLGGTITRNTATVNLLNYQLQYNASGSWQNIGSEVNISGQSSVTIPPTLYSGTIPANISTFGFRVQVTDAMQTTTGTETTLTFKKMIFYGASATPDTWMSGSAQVRILSGKIFADGPNPFINYTDTVSTFYNCALPSGSTIATVVRNGIPVPTSYKLQSVSGQTGITHVNDAAGNPVPYNVYTCTIGFPYLSNNTDTITRT